MILKSSLLWSQVVVVGYHNQIAQNKMLTGKMNDFNKGVRNEVNFEAEDESKQKYIVML